MGPDVHSGGEGPLRGSTGRRSTAVAWGLAALYVAVFCLTLWGDLRLVRREIPDAEWFAWVVPHGVWLGPFIAFAIMGAVIASRRPRHTIGWVMIASALCAGLGQAATVYGGLAILGSPADPPLVAVLLRLPSEPLTVLGVLLGLMFVPLLFPDGRLPSRRWRPIPWAAGAFLTLYLLDNTSSSRVSDFILTPAGERIDLYDVGNPLHSAGMERIVSVLRPPASAGDLVVAGLVIAAVTGVIVRFRRSESVERQQMKWFVYAAALVASTLTGLIAWTVTTGRAGLFDPLGASLLVAGLSAYPVAVGIAVLRYRLYEIDRIISRTVSYGLVVAVLAGVYVAGVVGLGAAVTALTGQGDSDLVVAVSTLAAAGLFQPVRSRIQTTVDRRFNRTGYEARRAVEAFTRDVRDEVDLDRIHRQVAETAAVATQPTHASVWLPDRVGR